ncbi:MAG TPA: RdgB/HAM1 family non-canonical purine NTP pyrophosphatase [Acidimicrobiales bacterium]|jgi:XTP/dITP diphosphohydrolase|nr:RdgB/HAM1 family non-canonical purine NTP pyrophosphatase [Acidimicrobiales bacterium]HJM37927.1 RdgB/HAM1 family non-canonical purine NTP pyrophosphatase [Acidimicrobiales bacterium]
MSIPKLVIASANPDKVAEIAIVLEGLAVLIPRPEDMPDVIEDGDNLEDNARLKAVAVCEFSGKPSVADDTGLEIDALEGAPGVYSARFAGPDATYQQNVEKVLHDLDGIQIGQRTARFKTVAIVRYPDGRELISKGTVEGCIALNPSGGEGFGYDPIFVPVEGDGSTFAQMGEEKHRFSHRGRAFRNLGYMLGSN